MPGSPQKLFVGLVASLYAGVALGATAASTLQPTRAPQPDVVAVPLVVAYVYVTSNYAGSTNQILAFESNAFGVLKPSPGSPYAGDVTSITSNGKYLFATGNATPAIETYAVGAHGALRYLRNTNVQSLPESSCALPGLLTLDHTGHSLYPFVGDADCSGSNSAYMSLAINESNGTLKFLSETDPSQYLAWPIAISGNDRFVYQASCVSGIPALHVYERQATGALVDIGISGALAPVAADPGTYYCPLSAATGPAGAGAVDFALLGIPGAPDQIGAYAIDDAGNVSSTSTAANMPQTAVGRALVMRTSPSGDFLAVGGVNGLQIFNFNGANPVTAATGLLVPNQIDSLYWDTADHLYAISKSAGLLYVFTVASGGIAQAPGSPHTIPAPQAVFVRSIPQNQIVAPEPFMTRRRNGPLQPE